MLTVIPPAVLLVVALIYLPYAFYYMWKLHSAQITIRRNHSLPTTTWAFQQKEYDENQEHLEHYSTLFYVFLWIAACCGLELSFGHHTRFMPLDYCILFIGSLGAVGLYLGLRPDKNFFYKESPHGYKATSILFFCSVYAFSWEFGLILAFFGGAGWLLSSGNPPEA